MQARILYTVAEDALLSWVTPSKHRYANLCHRIEQLGPAAIKLGQLMATTPGLIKDPVLQAQLSSRLHDRVRPQPFSEVLAPHKFAELNEIVAGLTLTGYEPIGSASIAQVHQAQMVSNGKAVALKIVRPHAGRLIHNSFEAIQSSVKLVHRWLPSAGDDAALHHTELLLQDACSMLQAELDMAAEFGSMQQFYSNASKGSLIRVPKPLGHFLDGQVLLMEYVHSQPLAIAKACMKPATRRETAQAIAAWWLESILRHRIVHGDPHVGNWGLTDTGQLVLYDYGNVVSLSVQDLKALMRLLEALVGVLTKFPGQAYFKGEATRVGETCGVHILDWDTFETDVADIVGYLTAPGIVQIDNEKMKTRRRVPARLSGPALRLVRSLLLIDGVCRSLDDQFAWRL